MNLDAVQKKIIRSKALGYNLVRGEAGSGKTTVAVNRGIYLKDNYCLYEADKVLIIAQNDRHLHNIKEILRRAEEQRETELITFFSNQVDKIHLETIDKIVYSYFLEYKKIYEFNSELISDIDKKNIIIECIEKAKKSYKTVKILDLKYTDFFVDEINWIKGCGYLELNSYQDSDRVGRKVGKGEGPQRLLKNSKAREAIFNVMLLYKDILSERNLVDSGDITLLSVKYAKDSKEKYTHIIVDDSENLTKIQLEFLDALCNKKVYSNIMLITNKNKPLNQNGWIVKGRKFSSLGLDKNTKRYSLTKNYTLNKTSEEDMIIVEEKHSDEGNSKMGKNNSTFIESFQYCDLRHNRKFEFIRDINNISEIIVKNEDSELIYNSDELKELALYSDIAAGEPILMNSDVEGDFFIPNYWLKGIKECFMLRVKGDSMIGADIEDGDSVVIRKQSTAQNNDIVAVDLDGSATLKRLQIGKGRIVLMPENEKYSPIIVTDNEVSIIGVAVGVVKEKTKLI